MKLSNILDWACLCNALPEIREMEVYLWQITTDDWTILELSIMNISYNGGYDFII